jgi:hypothetical protein
MIAYLFWHRAYPTTTVKQYEEALMRFQQRLGQQQPPGFGGSASFRVAALPWLGNRPGYEDWCLLDGSWALDPLNAFAVAGPVMSAHDSAAAQMEEGHGGLYALVWGEPVLPKQSTAVWLTRPRGIQWRTTLDALRAQLPGTTLWRRQMVLGLARSSFSSCRPVSMSPHQQAGRRWPSSACASMRPLICSVKAGHAAELLARRNERGQTTLHATSASFISEQKRRNGLRNIIG